MGICRRLTSNDQLMNCASQVTHAMTRRGWHRHCGFQPHKKVLPCLRKVAGVGSFSPQHRIEPLLAVGSTKVGLTRMQSVDGFLSSIAQPIERILLIACRLNHLVKTIDSQIGKSGFAFAYTLVC